MHSPPHREDRKMTTNPSLKLKTTNQLTTPKSWMMRLERSISNAFDSLVQIGGRVGVKARRSAQNPIFVRCGVYECCTQ